MINKLIFEGPANNLSMGNVSVNLLLALWRKKIDILYSPIGNADISNYNLPEEFKIWLNQAAQRFHKEFDRNLFTIRNWHLAGSHSWITNKRYLLSYHECDSVTPEELQIVKNIDKVFFCGTYSPKVFADYGVNCDSFNLGVDELSFKKLNKTYFTDNRINWLCTGKIEARKATLKIIELWARKYGKKRGESYKDGEQMHTMSCCIINPFYDVKIQEQQIAQVLKEQYINIQFFPFLGREQYNDLYNSCEIDLTGLSLAESWNLPSFNFTSLGKWSIVLNAHGHKSWSTPQNSIQVSPNGKENIADGIHFHPYPNSLMNIGNRFTWDSKDVELAMDTAVEKVKNKIPNVEGEKLATEFTYDKSLDYILTKIEEDLNKK